MEGGKHAESKVEETGKAAGAAVMKGVHKADESMKAAFSDVAEKGKNVANSTVDATKEAAESVKKHFQ